MEEDEEILAKIREFVYEQVRQRVLSSPDAAWDTLDMGKDLLQMYLLLHILEQSNTIDTRLDAIDSALDDMQEQLSNIAHGRV